MFFFFSTLEMMSRSISFREAKEVLSSISINEG